MNPRSAQDLVNMGYYGYRGWGDTEALADFRATGGKGKGGPSSQSSSSGGGQNFANSFVDTIKKQVEDETKFLASYTKDNPFVFDEALAKESSRAQYEPYYSELLNDYLADVDTKRATIQDERKLAQDLYKLDTAQRTRDYDRAIGQAEEGFVGQGMFFSGIKERTLGQAEVDKGAQDEGRELTRSARETGYDRELGVLDTGAFRRTRDVGREQQAAVEGGILQRQDEQQKAYQGNMLSAYQRAFPTSSNALAGYTIPNYLRY